MLALTIRYFCPTATIFAENITLSGMSNPSGIFYSFSPSYVGLVATVLHYQLIHRHLVPIESAGLSP